MLIKKVGNIIMTMIVGLPFRWLEKEDKSSSDIVMTSIQAFVVAYLNSEISSSVR